MPLKRPGNSHTSLSPGYVLLCCVVAGILAGLVSIKMRHIVNMPIAVYLAFAGSSGIALIVAFKYKLAMSPWGTSGVDKSRLAFYVSLTFWLFLFYLINIGFCISLFNGSD